VSCAVEYSIPYTIGYSCVLFVGDGFNRTKKRKTGKGNGIGTSTKVYVTKTRLLRQF
jgi:predicted nucleic acid-binding Zn ribbon protein